MLTSRACLLLFVFLPQVWGWGHDGHRLVARIAAKNLSPATRAKLLTILQTNDAGLEAAMAAAATWPDEINKKATGTDLWHFIDVPITTAFSLNGLCPQHDCVVDRIKEMSDRLQRNLSGFTLKTPPNPPRPMTSQELAFLIHFVGDIHQPLHAATDGDRGGNCVKLTHPLHHSDGSTTTELHAVWDNDEVFAVFDDFRPTKPPAMSDEDNAAQALFLRYKKAGVGAWEQEPVKVWTRESNDLAKKDVYGSLHLANHTAAPGQCAVGIAPVIVSKAYLKGNVTDVEQQLMRAGIRLSDILNSICAGNGCNAAPTS